MESLLNNFHVMPWHGTTELDGIFSRFKPNWIKVVRPEGDKIPTVDIAMRHAQKHVLLRSWLISENWEQRGVIGTPDSAVAVGNKIANAYKNILRWMHDEFGYSNKEMEKVVVEVALNEPHFWTDGEPPELAALCTKVAVDNMTASGVRVAALNAGVSWAGNNDTPEHPHPGAIPDWSPFLDLFKAIDRNGGWLSVHEYCDYLEHDGQYGYKFNWGWWGGHVYSLLPYFDAAGVKIPILITEAGIDNYVNSNISPSVPRGWLSLVNSGHSLADAAARYVDILGWYDQQLSQFPDGLIEAIMVYTLDIQNKEWESFDIRYEEFLTRLERHIDWMHNQTPETLEKPIIPAYDTDVPWYPSETEPPTEPPEVIPPTDEEMITAIRWNAEQSVRVVEAAMSEVKFAIETASAAVVQMEESIKGMNMTFRNLSDARKRLLDNVIQPLYEIEGVNNE